MPTKKNVIGPTEMEIKRTHIAERVNKLDQLAQRRHAIFAELNKDGKAYGDEGFNELYRAAHQRACQELDIKIDG